MTLDRDARRETGADIKTMQCGWPPGMLVRKLAPSLREMRSHVPGGVARTGSSRKRSACRPPIWIRHCDDSKR